nr:tRNA (guanosine(37)-N1)-methyltransferase TrmD [Candidatus Levybacteria bacterium]
MKISIITLFPEMFKGPFEQSIIKRAIDRKVVEIKLINLRDFGIGKHQLVDDTPYGGGMGMVLRVDVLENAIKNAKDKKLDKNKQRIILLSAHGGKFDQKLAREFSELENLILICGHYEGFDERIKEYIDQEISVGDFILTGGEIPAMLITDSVLRLVKGVIKEESWTNESFSPLLEYPHYTKPRIYKKSTVPQILLSGNHG